MQKIGLPEAFLARMQEMLGEEYEAFLKSYEKERVQGLRVNEIKIDKQSFEQSMPFVLTPVKWCSTGYFYEQEERPGKHPYHEAGLYYIQEPSAMAVVELLKPEPGDRVLDLCAAPGGKTSHIASKLKGKGFLLSNEIHPQRARILSQNVERMGIRNAVVTNESAKHLAERFAGFFDKIVVDAPCSGEGMFRKDENARAEWSLENVRLCTERQREILEEADRMLCPGGRMVYSTCTFSREEDEEMVAEFLQKHAEYELADCEVCDGFVSCGKSGMYRLFPHKLNGEGHFVAVLEKKGQAGIRKLPSLQTWIKDSKQLAPYEEWKKTSGLRLDGDGYILFGDQLYLVPPEMTDMKGLKVVRPGFHLGSFKKNRFEPSHALALALSSAEVDNTVSFEAGSKEIQAYLRGESIVLTGTESSTSDGWCLVLVDGYSTGWGKVSRGTLKNHYPKGLRTIVG